MRSHTAEKSEERERAQRYEQWIDVPEKAGEGCTKSPCGRISFRKEVGMSLPYNKGRKKAK